MHGQPRSERLNRRTLLRAATASALVGGLAACMPADSHFLMLGTAETEGVYFQVGNAIAYLVNRNYQHHGVRCLPQSMPGSSANVTALQHRAIPLALVQGNDIWTASAPDRASLRVLAALHIESLVVLAANGVASLDDLPGRRVALGPRGSGHRTAMNALLAVRGWTPEHFAAVDQDSTRSSLSGQCQGIVDAVPMMIGHPVSAVVDTTTRCHIHALSLSERDRTALVEAGQGFELTTVPAGAYGADQPELATVGARVHLACTADLPDHLAMLIVNAMLGDLDALRRSHPVLRTLTAQSLRPAPDVPIALHDGAHRAYREAGVA